MADKLFNKGVDDLFGFIAGAVSGAAGGGGTPSLDVGGGFAEGGVPPVGKPSIVGERGPELFMPKSLGTIIPNHAINKVGGGQPIVVNQNFNISPGVSPEVAALVFREAQKTEHRTIARIVKMQRDTAGRLL